MKKDLERAEGSTGQLPIQMANSTSRTPDVGTVTESPLQHATVGPDAWLRYQWQRWFSRPNRTEASSSNPQHSLAEAGLADSTDVTLATAILDSQPLPTESVSTSSTPFKWLRSEYDLQPYGLGMVIDLRWS